MNILNLPASNERRYLKIAKDLSARIEAGEYRPGSRLPPERELAAALGVSRTTVREALLALELMAIVEIRVGSGVFVLRADPKGAEAAQVALSAEVGPFEIVEMRRIVEGGVASRAAERISALELDRLAAVHSDMERHVDDIDGFDRADREFHMLIAEATGNSLMQKSVRELWDMRAGPLWMRWYDQTRSLENRVQSMREHGRILMALRRGLPEVAGTAMRAHIDVLADRFLQLNLDPDETPATPDGNSPTRRG